MPEKKDFIKHVGVEYKRYSNGKFTTADLCFAAAQKLIEELNWSPSEIGLVILVTQTPDYTLPASSILLQNRLGLNKNIIAFDINLGCSGWVYGLSVAAGLMKSLKIDKGLLLTGETSVIAEYKNKTTFPLMGDAGTATALLNSDNSKMSFDLNTNGAGYDAIIAHNSGARFFSASNAGNIYNHYVSLDSQRVLEFCLFEVVPSVKSLMDSNAIALTDIDYFIFHQANKIINENLRKKLGVPSEKFPYSLREFSNTSSASIPLTIVTQLANEIKSKKLTMLCSGFGVGLSWGSVILKTEKVVCPELIEL
ncbi:MAG: ketoacyl-ACP synthase III [Bacteroidota bacterium]